MKVWIPPLAQLVPLWGSVPPWSKIITIIHRLFVTMSQVDLPLWPSRNCMILQCFSMVSCDFLRIFRIPKLKLFPSPVDKRLQEHCERQGHFLLEWILAAGFCCGTQTHLFSLAAPTSPFQENLDEQLHSSRIKGFFFPGLVTHLGFRNLRSLTKDSCSGLEHKNAGKFSVERPEGCFNSWKSHGK